MKYQIDQSHKIEQTEKDTVLALSNDIQFAIVLKAKDKRAIQNEFRKREEPRNFIIFTFSVLIVILLKHVKPASIVSIDIEYKGSEKVIWDRLIEYSRIINFNLDRSLIQFKSVGKNSPAHILAAKVAIKKIKPNIIVKLEEVLTILFSNKKDRASLKDLGALNCGLDTADRRPSRSNKKMLTLKHTDVNRREK